MISEDKRQGYLDGYAAALESARSTKLLVSPEIDNSIALGISCVSATLEHNLKILKEYKNERQ